MAVSRKATVEPVGLLAASEGPGLSPAAMLAVRAGQRIRLYSPDGGILSAVAAASGRAVYAACLRNGSAVAAALEGDGPIGLVPAGERWPDGSLRVAVEDLLGVGAVPRQSVRRQPTSASAHVAVLTISDAWIEPR